MQSTLRKKKSSAPQASAPSVKPVEQTEVQGAVQLQRTIGNRQTGELIREHGPLAVLQGGGVASRVQPKLRPSAKTSGPRIQRAPDVVDFADADAAEKWYNDEKGELEANPLRKTRLQKATEYFLESVGMWKDYEAQELTAKEYQQDLIKKYKLALKLEELEGAVNTQINGVKDKAAPLKEIVEIIKPGSWLRSYATEEQIGTMNTIKDNFNPAISSRQLYIQKLQPILKKVTDVTDIQEFVWTPFFNQIKEDIAKAKEEAPLSAFNEGYKEDAANLKIALENQAKDRIKTKLEAARDDGAKLLDVEGAVPEVVTAVFKKELASDQVDTLITKALEIQHNPGKDIWLRKVVGLAPGLGGAYMKNIAKIDNKDTHVTRYADGVPDKPSVLLGGVTLKNDILGNGVTAFHVTIETGGASHEKPHAYRGGITLTRWNLYPQGGSGFANAGDLQTALENSLAHQVTQAENAIDTARTNKGKGLQTQAVRGWLKN
ncbi:hypothetical protein B5M42_002565 [Paenibacillus athensensis]|uniref:Uncharacterized protein n=1 Tax=Paenibacillus athensensis TaxID=1967502 RepID=A0A4Y8QAY9_9BACL|nr:hypothetical protein [Paenibacillus athensensis]MCD1257722.1 hypothetical protein [Paenibacillus athensensis]